mgnify:CR=1 FL=1
MKTASCFGPAHILLPGEDIPLEKWGCVACDQFTSDRAYWEQADAVVGGCPSTLRLILPEVYLEDKDAPGGWRTSTPRWTSTAATC